MSIGFLQNFKDQQSFQRLRNRDRETFAEVYDEHVREINRFVYFKVGSQDEANDLTSIIFLKAWHHIQNKTLEDAKTLRALLYKIARNAIIDYYRETGRKAVTSLDNEKNPIDMIDDTISPEERVDTAANLEMIRQQLPRLKEEYREVIIMRFISDLSLEEIAEITGKTKGNIRVLLHRSLSALRELIEENKAL